jgi:hypothetical protein
VKVWVYIEHADEWEYVCEGATGGWALTIRNALEKMYLRCHITTASTKPDWMPVGVPVQMARR